MAHDVFISYATENKRVADAICARLEQAHIRCWIAPRDIPSGASWPAAITEAIRACRVMVLVFTANSNASGDVLKEVSLASKHNKAILPFRTEPIEPSAGLDYYLNSTHWLDALTPPVDQHIHRLQFSILTLLRPDPIPDPIPTADGFPVPQQSWLDTLLRPSVLDQRNLLVSAALFFLGGCIPFPVGGSGSNSAASLWNLGVPLPLGLLLSWRCFRLPWPMRLGLIAVSVVAWQLAIQILNKNDSPLRHLSLWGSSIAGTTTFIVFLAVFRLASLRLELLFLPTLTACVAVLALYLPDGVNTLPATRWFWLFPIWQCLVGTSLLWTTHAPRFSAPHRSPVLRTLSGFTAALLGAVWLWHIVAIATATFFPTPTPPAS
jgi:hypothetical protein